MGKRKKSARNDQGASSSDQKDSGFPGKSDTSAGGKGGEASSAGREGDLTFPKWFPAVLYGAVTLLLFRKFVFSGEMLLGQDTLSLGYVAREFFAEALRGGTFPLWNPIILGGTPFLDSLAGGDSLYPTSLLLLVMEPYRALGWKLVLHVFAAGLFAYGWIRALGRSRAAALLCGLAYLMAPFMVTLVFPGHDGKLFVTALTPLLFWVTERALAEGRIRSLGAMALVIGLVILTTHFQQAYFLFGSVGVYAAVRVALLWKAGLPAHRSALRFLLFLGFSLLGAGVAAIQLVPAVGYVKEFSRRTATTTQATEQENRAYSSSWSLHPEEVAAMVVPEFVGSNARGASWAEDTYWGRNPMKHNHEYAGFVVLLLAALAFFGAPKPGIRFTFLGIGGVALLFALGAHTPVWRVFYEVLPGISLFRAPSIAAFLFGFGAMTLMAFGVDRVLGLGSPCEARGDRRILWFLAGSTGLLLLGTALASSGALTSGWTALLYSDLPTGKADALSRAQDFITRGFFLSTLLSAATLGLVWMARKGKVPAGAWVLGIGLLVVVDLGRVNDAFIQTLSFQDWAAEDPNIQFLQEQLETQDPFRVLAMGGGYNNGQDVKPGMYGLELAAGHHPNDLARYRELIGMVGSGLPQNFFHRETGALNLPLLSILNVRYVIWPVYQYGGLPQGEVVMASSLGGNQVYEAVYEIPTLPRARLVADAAILSDEEAVSYILSDEFRPAEEVTLVHQYPEDLSRGAVDGEIRWLERSPNRSRLQVRSSAAALLVLAENWYPAWKADVNGGRVPVLRANHSLRAVPVPAGESEVEVFFDAGSLRGSLFLSLASLGLALGVIFVRPREGKMELGGERESEEGGKSEEGA